MIRSAAMPLARCSSMRAMTWSAEAFNWSSSMARAGLKARMSYQLGMTQPPLTVTAWLGAWGRMKRVLGRTTCRASATGLKSVRSAPRPCSQMMQASAFGASRIRGSLITAPGRGICVRNGRTIRQQALSRSQVGQIVADHAFANFPRMRFAKGSAPGTPFVARRRRTAGCPCRCRGACGYSAATGREATGAGPAVHPGAAKGVANR